MADDALHVKFDLTADTSKLESQFTGTAENIKVALESKMVEAGEEIEKSLGETSKKAQSVCGETSEKINAILADTSRTAQSKAASIAAIYKKSGMSSQEAFSAAWKQIERDSTAGAKTVKKQATGILEKIKSVFANVTQGSKNTKVSVGRDISATMDDASKMQAGITRLAQKAGLALAAAFSVTKLVSFGKQCLELGSDLAEVQNVVDVTFPSMSSKVDEFAKSAAASFGLSETMAKQYTGTFGAMAKAFGFAEQQAYDMGSALTALTGDVASFYNLEQDEAYTKLKSVFTGETESLKELGVVMTQTALDQYALANGFGKTTSAMSEAEKVSLRYAFVQDQLAAASGDFARTADGWANQTRVLSLQIDSLKANIGQGLINLLTPLLQLVNQLIAKLSVLTEKFKVLSETLTGSSSSESFSSAASSAAGIEASTAETAENLKKASRYLAGFDAVNKVSSSSDSSDTMASDTNTEAGTSGSVVGTAVSQTQDTIAGLAELKKQLDSFSKWFSAKFGKNIQNVLDGIRKKGKLFKTTLTGVFEDIRKLGVPLANYFDGEFAELINAALEDTGVRAEGLLDSLNSVFSDIWSVAVYPCLQKLITVGLPTITSFATECTKSMTTLFKETQRIFDEVWKGGIVPYLGEVSNIFTGLMDTIAAAWDTWGAPTFERFRETVANLAATFTNIWQTVLQPTWETIMAVIDQLWTEHLQPLAAKLLDFVGEFVNGAMRIYNEFVDPIVNWFVDTFGPAIRIVFDLVVKYVGTAAGMLADYAGGIISFFKGLLQFFVNVFCGDWNGAWDAICGGVKGAWEGIKGAWSGATGFFNEIWRGIKLVFAGCGDWFKKIFTNAWEGVKGVFSKGGKIFTGIVDGIADTFKSIVNKLIDGINSVVATPFRKINDMLNSIRSVSVLGAEPFKKLWSKNPLPIPEIPHLAEGGYVRANTPQLAMIGDNRHQGEVVAPEGKLLEMAKIAASMSGGSSELMQRVITLLEKLISLVEGGDDIVLAIDGEELARAVQTGTLKLKRRYTTVEVTV